MFSSPNNIPSNTPQTNLPFYFPHHSFSTKPLHLYLAYQKNPSFLTKPPNFPPRISIKSPELTETHLDPRRFWRQKAMGKKGIMDLEKHFAFYGAYHRNPTNILIHMIFVWPILFTTIVMLYFTPALIDCPFKCRLGLVPNIGLVFTVIYGVFYVCLDKKAGTFAAFLCFACWVFGSLLAKRLGFSLAWKVVLGAQLFCWTGQFIGHGVFEKRAPALLDNLTQAFLMAPFFVLLEALQSFGYEPYEGFHESVKAKIDSEVKKFQDQKAKKIS